jgi:hypothetical protein
MSSVKTVTYTTGDIADFCGVVAQTVQQWIKDEELKAFKLPGSNWARVYPQDLVTFMRKYGMNVPKEVSEKLVEQTT